MNNHLSRFIEPQEKTFHVALSEIRSGRKKSHWMWFIFPQLIGLSYSETSQYYAIRSLTEAEQYLAHPILGTRLEQISKELLRLDKTDPKSIFGNPDYQKLKSSMTLFTIASANENSVYKSVLEKFFDGNFDIKTIELIKNEC